MENRTLTTVQGDDEGIKREEVERALAVVLSPDPEKQGVRVQLGEEDDVLPIGREANDGLRIRDPKLSRLHLRIVWDKREHRHRFGDAGSVNGTFLNGVRTAHGALEHGDVLRLGDTLIVYSAEEAPVSQLYERAKRAAPTDVGVLLIGETGTGKEVLARYVHEHSGLSGPFVAVNCSVLPKDLAAAELFGHTRGAFSGAQEARTGLFRSAQDGTLFLDEVGDLPNFVQPMLLRVLQERTLRPVGSEREVSVNARIVAATNVDLEIAIAEGRFREDLYARLAQVILRLVPLRVRRSQILELTRIFMSERSLAWTITPAVAEALLLYNWPQNVRELQSVIKAAAVVAEGNVFDMKVLAEVRPAIARNQRETLPPPPVESDRQRLEKLLQEHNGNVTAVAKALGKPRAQIYRWMKRYGLDVKSQR